jgi:tetratricopeptide (TPR) repeat protein
LNRAAELAPNSDAAYRDLGDAYSENHNDKESVSAYQKAVSMNPYYWLNHTALGNAYLGLGDYAKALPEFQNVIEIAPENPMGYESVGSVYLRQDKWEKAISQYQKSLALAPNAVTYSNLGTAYFFMKNYDQATKTYEIAVQINASQNEELWGNLGDAYRSLGQAEKARAAYKKAIGIAKMNPAAQSAAPVLGDLALYYAKIGDQTQAVQHIRLARAKSPGDVQIIYTEGQVYVLLGQTTKAISAYRQAVAKGYVRQELWNDPENARLQSVPEFVELCRTSLAR